MSPESFKELSCVTAGARHTAGETAVFACSCFLNCHQELATLNFSARDQDSWSDSLFLPKGHAQAGRLQTPQHHPGRGGQD